MATLNDKLNEIISLLQQINNKLPELPSLKSEALIKNKKPPKKSKDRRAIEAWKLAYSIKMNKRLKDQQAKSDH